ncbi:hypothetical protein L6R50_13395 [Myxococcota bacterium]|nr:hypothetical protein [Myxococcota bacterium]
MADGREPRNPLEVLLSHREMQARTAVSRRMSEAQALLRDLRGPLAAEAEPGAQGGRARSLREWALAEVGRAAQDWARFGGDVRLILPADSLASAAGGLTGSVPDASLPISPPIPPSELAEPVGASIADRNTDGGEAVREIPAAEKPPSGPPRVPLPPSLAAALSASQGGRVPPPAAPPSLPLPPSLPTAERLSAAEVKAMVQGFGKPKWARDGEDPGHHHIDPAALAGLGDLLAEVPMPPAEPMDKITVRKELDLLLNATGDPSTARWVGLPSRIQRALVGYLACRARRVQDQEGAAVRAAGLEDKLDPVFSRLSAYSKRHQPGWVKGLSFGHTPDRGSWYEDAVHWQTDLQRALGVPEEKRPSISPERLLAKVEKAVADCPATGSDVGPVVEALRDALEGGVRPDDPRLTRLAQPYHDAMVGAGPGFKELRRAIRRVSDPEGESADESSLDVTSETGPPADWAWWPVVRGKRAVIVGGDRREDARKRLQEVFNLASLEWIPLQHENNTLRSLASSVAAGGIDLVLLLRRFVPHQADEILIPACKSAGVPWVSVERGYGVERVRQALERYLRAEAA